MKTERAMSDPSREGGQASERHEEMRKFFERLRVDGEILLGGSGFHIVIQPDLPAVMAFAHETRSVLINPDRIFDRELDDREKRYVFGHEIAHFVQLASDPDTYLRMFELQEKKAQQAPQPYKNQVQKMWGRFCNVFLDIHDNAIGDRRAMWAQASRPGEHPRETLYQKLAPEDLSGDPKSEQFLFSVLRRAMLGTEAPLVIDSDVKEVLEKSFSYLGKTYPSFFDFARRKFFDAELPLSTFLSVLERSAAPLFERFLQQDMEAGVLDQAERPVDLDGSDMDPQAGKEMAKGVKKIKASPAEKASAKEGKDFYEKMRLKGFSDSQIHRMREIRERANEVFGSLVDLWQVFIQTTMTSEIQQDTQNRAGFAPDVQEFIRQFPSYETQPDQLRIFLRRFLVPEVESYKPKLIELHLVIDLSGSMDPIKRRETQETVYALARSLVQFRRNKSAFAKEHDPATQINIRIIGFGNTHQDLFLRSPLEQQSGSLNDEQPEELDERLWKAILAIESLGLINTKDAPALDDVLADISRPDRNEAFTNGDRVAVVIEVTDGETDTVEESESIVTELNRRRSVYARGIQIPGSLQVDDPKKPAEHGEGESSVSELIKPSGKFEQVWGKNGQRLDHLEQLRTVVLKLLFEALLSQQKSE